MDKKIFNKMYNKTAEHNTQDCLDRFKTNAGISLDELDLSDLNFFLWNSSSLSTLEENSLVKIMSIRSAICHPSSSHSYSIDELERYWSDLKSAVVLFAEPKCYKDIVEMQVETLQNCKLNVIESAKVIEKMKIESDKILHAIKQATPLKVVDIEKLIKDGTCGLENCVKSENNKTKSYINATFREFKENIEKHHEVLSTKCREEIQTTVTQESGNTRLHSEDQSRAIDSKLTESEQRVCQTVIQSRGRLEEKLIKEHNKARDHTVELKADLMEENRILKDEVMDVKTELKELKTILIGYIGKQKVDLVMNTDQIEKSTESPDKGKVDFTAKVNQTRVTADEENEIIDKLPPEVEIQTNNAGLPDAAVTETIEITGKKVNSIILELKATPGILHSVETFKAAILTLVQVMQKAGGIDADIEDTVTVNLKFESPLTEDQFAVVKCIFAKELKDGCNTKQLSAEYSSISNEYSSISNEYSSISNEHLSTSDEYSSTSDEYLSTEDVNETEFRSEPDTYSQKETSEVFQLETTEPLIKSFCELCDYKDKIMKVLYEQIDIYVKINKRNMINQHPEQRKLEDLQAEQRKLEGLLIQTRPDDTGMISDTEKLGAIQKELKSSPLRSLELEHTYDSSSKKTLYECRHCCEMEVIIIQLDRRLCEIRRRIIEAKGQSFFMYYISVNKAFEDLLKITDQNTIITNIEEKGRMKDKESKSDRGSQDAKLISDVDVRDPETRANKKLMKSQAIQGRRPELDQTEEKSDLSLRISEIRRECASSSYTKTDKQKGLGIILQGESSRYFRHARDPDIRYLQEFFEEIGFVSKDICGINQAHLDTYLNNQDFYCIFIVIIGYEVYNGMQFIRYMLSNRRIGKPVIIMTDDTFDFPHIRTGGTFDFSHIRKDNEYNEILIVMPTSKGSTGPYRYPGEKKFFDDLMKVTRSNRCADIIDILTRINSLYDYPVITFQSSLRKKFCFL